MILGGFRSDPSPVVGVLEATQVGYCWTDESVVPSSSDTAAVDRRVAIVLEADCFLPFVGRGSKGESKSVSLSEALK